MAEKTKEETEKEDREAYELDHKSRNERVEKLKVLANKEVLSQADVEAAVKLLLSHFK